MTLDTSVRTSGDCAGHSGAVGAVLSLGEGGSTATTGNGWATPAFVAEVRAPRPWRCDACGRRTPLNAKTGKRRKHRVEADSWTAAWCVGDDE